MAWLDDNPPVRSQFRRPRREQVSGVIVVHTAENTPDFVAFDGGAEAVANFIRNRDTPGSYHELCDSDSAINLVGYDAEAYHDATGSNPHSFGVSAATRADVWPLAPEEWRNGCIASMAARCADYARWVEQQRGVIIPARRITREQSEAHIPGFISHAERDPARRTDPGKWFPWDQFLAEYARQMGSQPQEVPLSAAEVQEIKNHIDATAYQLRLHMEHVAKMERGPAQKRLDALLAKIKEHIDATAFQLRQHMEHVGQFERGVILTRIDGDTPTDG